ncbi:serine hydrolase domain-containing protein [Nocardia sp. NBC_01009]|uniref:serine hydrolase domain-containing protein n=1 Tax=Nocardia sp. NBC_01009 TaxID=2975996 RepID=UPI00386FEDA2|nr:beta-lactamase family protein [Nocardia sp. NBC_01009]
MKTQSPLSITATRTRIDGVHQLPVIPGKAEHEVPETTRGTKDNSARIPRVFRRVAVTALAATLLTGAAALGLATADNPAVPDAPAGQDRPELQQAIQEIVDAGITGVQLRIHDQRGEWVGSAGVRELGQAAKPPTDGRFRIGSATKTFYSTVVLQLVAEGKIGLDAPAADYLPEFGLDRRITVRMLLQHTSGLFNYTGEYYPDGTVAAGIPWQGKEWVDNRFHNYPPEELVRLALSKPTRFEPGTDWSYSNTNYALARLLIEKVTGSSHAEEIQRRILRPLELSDTVVPGASPEIAEPHAHGYYKYEDAGQWKTIDVTRQNPSWISAGGDMISTTEDLHTFFSGLLGGKLLPAALLAEMSKGHPTPDPKMSYGLGLEVRTVDCGGTVLSSDGGVQGYGTLLRSTADGSRTLEASLTYVDADQQHAPVEAQLNALQRLTNEGFCGGQTAG